MVNIPYFQTSSRSRIRRDGTTFPHFHIPFRLPHRKFTCPPAPQAKSRGNPVLFRLLGDVICIFYFIY